MNERMERWKVLWWPSAKIWRNLRERKRAFWYEH